MRALKNRKSFFLLLVAAAGVAVVTGVLLLRGDFIAYFSRPLTGLERTESGEDVGNGRGEYYYKYGAIAEDFSFHQVDADYDLFKDTSYRPKFVLPEHTDLQNMEEVISDCILVVNRKAYRMGEKALGAHKIYRTEEKDGVINVYIRVGFQWFGFENGVFTVVSGVSGHPVMMQMQRHENGTYEVLEYRQAMDGGMFAESVREMFPEDLAELVVQGDDKSDQELWNMQVLKAGEYLEEIDRKEAPVLSRVAKETADEKAAGAVNLVTAMRPEFPHWQGTRELLVRAGGPHPGINVRAVLETESDSKGEGRYKVTLTRTWNITVNDVQPVSYWKYAVTGERVELIEEQDLDYMIKTIK